MGKFKYFKNITRDKTLMFYMFIFPFILALLYYFATGSIVTPELDVERVGLTEQETVIPYETIFEDIEPFELERMSEEEAGEQLESGEIIGYIQDNNSLLLLENGTSQSILKGIVDEIIQISLLGADAQFMDIERNFVDQKEIPATYITIMFYGLIGMTALFGSFRGVELSSEILAPMSPFAARISATPVKRYRYIGLNYLIMVGLSFLSASLVIVFLEILLDFPFIQSFGWSLLLVLCLVCFGISLGMLVGIIPNLSAGAKDSLSLALILGLTMMAGGMSPEIPRFIYRVAPWLMKINPVSTFTENFYRINLLNDYSTLTSGLLYLILVTVALTTFVMIYLRGKKYDSL